MLRALTAAGERLHKVQAEGPDLCTVSLRPPALGTLDWPHQCLRGPEVHALSLQAGGQTGI